MHDIHFLDATLNFVTFTLSILFRGLTYFWCLDWLICIDITFIMLNMILNVCFYFYSVDVNCL